MKTKNSVLNLRKNYFVDIAALVPFLMLLLTGGIMLIYHTGKPKPESIFGINAYFWLNIHITFALISFVIILVHLSFHLNWFKTLFSTKRKNKYWLRNLLLVLIFISTTFTSFIPLLILEESQSADILLGIHNKFGLLLVVFFLIHLLSYSKWLIRMTKKVLMNNSNMLSQNEGF